MSGDDDTAGTGEVDLEALPLPERIWYVRWYSHTPAIHLLEMAAETADRVADLDLTDRLAFAELVVSLRATEHISTTLAALEPDADNEWVRQLLAELVWLQGRPAIADALIRAECASLGEVEPDLQRRWLWLAARRGPTVLGALADALDGSASLDGTVIEADLGCVISRERRDRFTTVIAGQVRMDEHRARRVVDLLADRMEAGWRFRSQAVPWFAFDTYSENIVARVVGEALAAADSGRGYSALRLGDGEAQVLAGVMPDITGVLGVGADKEWNELGDVEYVALRERLAAAITSADFVGVPDLAQCLAGPMGYSEVPATCLEIGVDPDRIVPGGCDLGWALEISGQVDRLIARCNGIIGPIDPRGLQRIPGDADLTWLSVPGELLYYYDEGGLETSHWRRFEAITSYDYRPGEIWLVGAGVLGKVYCHAIQQAGAVAVDIGSVLDAWAGRQDTRGTVREQLWVTVPYLEDSPHQEDSS